jgi:hypothetical protein
VTAQAGLFDQPKPKGATPGPWSISRTHRPGVVAELTYLEGSLLRTLYIVSAQPIGSGEADALLLAAAPVLHAAAEEAMDMLTTLSAALTMAEHR